MGIPAVGGVDRNITVWGGLELVFDGLGGGGGSDEEAPAKKPPAKAKKPPREAEPDESEDVREVREVRHRRIAAATMLRRRGGATELSGYGD